MEQVVWILLETTDVIAQQGIQATTVKRVKLSNNTSADKKNTAEKKKIHEERNSEKYGFKALSYARLPISGIKQIKEETAGWLCLSTTLYTISDFWLDVTFSSSMG